MPFTAVPLALDCCVHVVLFMRHEGYLEVARGTFATVPVLKKMLTNFMSLYLTYCGGTELWSGLTNCQETLKQECLKQHGMFEGGWTLQRVLECCLICFFLLSFSFVFLPAHYINCKSFFLYILPLFSRHWMLSNKQYIYFIFLSFPFCQYLPFIPDFL